MTAARAIQISLICAILVLALKWEAWRLTRSVALYSDALESFINVFGSFVALLALRVAAKPPDWNHPWGHAKAEYLSAITEGTLVAVAAAVILRAAWQRLHHPVPLESVGLGAGVAIVASALNVAVAVLLQRVGRRAQSPALLADSAHIFSDVLASAVILLGVGLTRVTRLWILDPLVAIAVTAFVARSAWKIVRTSVAGLMDEGVPVRDVQSITRAIEACLSPGQRFGDLRARRAGPRLFVDLKVLVSGETSVSTSHALCNTIEGAIRRVEPGADVVIHVEPIALVPQPGAGAR
jgi:cation diffusion facilitator family transporter